MLLEGEYGYINLMQNILENGEEREGRNGNTLSIFGEKLIFRLKEGFPLLTTKRVFWRGIVEELLWFLRGSTDVTELQKKNVNIWNSNSSREFLDSVGLVNVPEWNIGKAYGWQWRNASGTEPGNGVDQLKYIIEQLKFNPHGRRALLSAWNPAQLNEMALPPCHFAYNFYIGKNGLSCQMIMRSCDVGAGLPFNIASTSLFTCILAHALNIEPDNVHIITGDTHLYAEHIDSAKIQITRQPRKLPSLQIKSNPSTDSPVDILKWIESLKFEDFEICDYNPHPTLSFPMIT